MNVVQEYSIEIYQTEAGRQPFIEWLEGLKAVSTSRLVRARIERIQSGNLGDHRELGGGLFEFRIFHGPGYRIYFGKEGQRLILLLTGGSKGSQSRNIAKARAFLEDYRKR